MLILYSGKERGEKLVIEFELLISIVDKGGLLQTYRQRNREKRHKRERERERERDTDTIILVLLPLWGVRYYTP